MGSGAPYQTIDFAKGPGAGYSRAVRLSSKEEDMDPKIMLKKLIINKFDHKKFTPQLSGP